MGLNSKQREQLLRPINPKRVQRDNKGMSHVQAYDVAAHLTRIFGFGGWQKRITSLELVCEDSVKDGNRTGWWVTYRCQMTLEVKDPSGSVIWSGDDGATGSAANQPQRGEAHDLALKNAISYALKRCAKDLGDQFGLSLYNKGNMNALVGATLDQEDETADDVEKDLPDIHPEDEGEGQDGPQAAPSAAEAPPERAPRPARQQPPNGRQERAQRPQVKAPPGAETDIDWMGHLVDDLIPAATTRNELAGFWDNVAEHVREGKCTDEHAKQIQSEITERADALGFSKDQAA